MPFERSQTSPSASTAPIRTPRTRPCRTSRLGSSPGQSPGSPGSSVNQVRVRSSPSRTRNPRVSGRGVVHSQDASSRHDLGVQTPSSPSDVHEEATDTLGHDHSCLTLEIESLQHRKDLLSAEVHVLEMTKENDRLEAELTALRIKFQAVIDARHRALQCPKCKRVSREPMIIQECTHGFCLPCLREWFEDKVYERLKGLDLGELVHLKEPPYTSETLEKLRDAGHLVYVNWTCPSCDAYLWRKPKTVAFLNRLIDELSNTLGMPENLAARGPVGDDCWEGVLFGMAD